MDAPSPFDPPPQTSRFLVLYALAAAGGAAAYAPFLTLWLPVRVASLWPDDTVAVLSAAAFAGAIAASLANIGFGWASDRTGNRRGWIAGGALLSSLLLVAMQSAESVPALIALIAAWQIALNMMLGPLMAWAGDCVPDSQKGLLGGLLSFAPAMGALAGMVITLPGLADSEARLAVNALLVLALVLPVVLFGNPRRQPQLVQSAATGDQGPRNLRDLLVPVRGSAPVRRMWLARLLIQIPEATLFAFLLIWLTTMDPSTIDNDTARLFTAVLFVSVPLALIVGRWSDRARRPMLPLVLASGGAALGLLALALARDTAAAMAAYALFGTAAGVFLALHSSQTLRVLPRPQTRGRDLGFFNLTNTVPSLVMPGLTLTLIPAFGFEGLFLLLAVLAALSSALLLSMNRNGI